MQYDLISIGSITKDIFLVSDRGKIFKTPKDKLAPAWLGFELGEKICINETANVIGGVAINLTVGLKKLGLKTAPLGTIGSDAEGGWILNELRKAKMTSDLISIKQGRKSPVSFLLLDKITGERVIFYEKSSGEVDLSHLSKLRTNWLFISSLTGNCAKQIKIISDYAQKHQTRIIASPSTSQIRNDYRNLKKLLAKCEIIFLNRNEAIEIAFHEMEKNTSIKTLSKLLLGLGPKFVIITDGLQGANCFDGKKIYHVPIKKVKTVDVTGAGDAFAAGYLGYYLKGHAIQKCLEAGILNSASVVKFIGATKGLMSKNEIEKHLTK
jgi:sugar/nucleoside kinase (ribokinase family)